MYSLKYEISICICVTIRIFLNDDYRINYVKKIHKTFAIGLTTHTANGEHLP